MKRYRIWFTAILCSMLLFSCQEAEAPASESESSYLEESISLPDLSEVESSEPEEDDGSHTITLCNGLEQDVTQLRIKSDAEEYWSVEILQGTVWKDGTAIALTLLDTEWTFAPNWQLEVVLADSSTRNWEDMPLSDEEILELTEENEAAAQEDTAE